jgi:raffinose/stachyose/melibiose transport system permease protein
MRIGRVLPRTPADTVLLVVKLMIGIVFLAPFYITFTYSFKTIQEITFTGLSFPQTFHFENYARGMEIADFWHSLTNSILTTVPTALILMVICSMAAYALSRNEDSRVFNTLYYVFLGAILIPFQAVMLPLYVNLRSLGLLNTIPGFIIAKVSFQIPFTLLVMTGFVKTVPRELEQAAYIDGAGLHATFWLIVFPLMKPIVVTALVLNSLYAWNDFHIALIVLQDQTLRTLPLTQFFFFGENFMSLNLAFAVFTLSMIPIIALYLVLQRYIVSGITVGALKG